MPIMFMFFFNSARYARVPHGQHVEIEGCFQIQLLPASEYEEN